MQKVKIINQLFLVKTLLEKTGNQLIFKEFGLTISLYIPLKMIANGLSEISTIKTLSNESSVSLTQKIQKLENLDFITRSLHKTDKRKWIFEISTKGKEVLKKVEQKYEKMSNHLFDDFSENEEVVFFEHLQILEEKLKQKL